jgi:hypothetical protein
METEGDSKRKATPLSEEDEIERLSLAYSPKFNRILNAARTDMRGPKRDGIGVRIAASTPCLSPAAWSSSSSSRAAQRHFSRPTSTRSALRYSALQAQMPLGLATKPSHDLYVAPETRN